MTTWTTPKTWAGTTLAISDLNTHVRDNLNHLYERAAVYTVYKSADESLNTSTTLQNDDALLWAVAANERWFFRLALSVTDVSNGTADFKMGWSYPTSTTMKWASYSVGGGSLATWVPGITTAPSVVAYTESSTPAFGLTNGNHLFMFEGIVYVSGTAGNVTFQWAQNTSNGSNVTVQAGSNLQLFKLA